MKTIAARCWAFAPGACDQCLPDHKGDDRAHHWYARAPADFPFFAPTRRERGIARARAFCRSARHRNNRRRKHAVRVVAAACVRCRRGAPPIHDCAGRGENRTGSPPPGRSPASAAAPAASRSAGRRGAAALRSCDSLRHEGCRRSSGGWPRPGRHRQLRRRRGAGAARLADGLAEIPGRHGRAAERRLGLLGGALHRVAQRLQRGERRYGGAGSGRGGGGKPIARELASRAAASRRRRSPRGSPPRSRWAWCSPFRHAVEAAGCGMQEVGPAALDPESAVSQGGEAMEFVRRHPDLRGVALA